MTSKWGRILRTFQKESQNWPQYFLLISKSCIEQPVIGAQYICPKNFFNHCCSFAPMWELSFTTHHFIPSYHFYHFTIFTIFAPFYTILYIQNQPFLILAQIWAPEQSGVHSENIGECTYVCFWYSFIHCNQRLSLHLNLFWLASTFKSF